MKSKAPGCQRYIDDGIAVLTDPGHLPVDLEHMMAVGIAAATSDLGATDSSIGCSIDRSGGRFGAVA